MPARVRTKWAARWTGLVNPRPWVWVDGPLAAVNAASRRAPSERQVNRAIVCLIPLA